MLLCEGQMTLVQSPGGQRKVTQSFNAPPWLTSWTASATCEALRNCGCQTPKAPASTSICISVQMVTCSHLPAGFYFALLAFGDERLCRDVCFTTNQPASQ
ncbi:unnamed protein product [Effrenium voratum]|nr:unnamed protein product [Effrenium voratum]